MSYKKATELSPSLFKRRYGVSLKTFWKMVEVVRNAKQESRGSHAKLSISDQILMALQYWREYRTYFHIALILGNPWSYSISDSQENWRHFNFDEFVKLQHLGLSVSNKIMETQRWNNYVEPYLDDLKIADTSSLLDLPILKAAYESTFAPLISIALRQGFTRWSYR